MFVGCTGEDDDFGIDPIEDEATNNDAVLLSGDYILLNDKPDGGRNPDSNDFLTQYHDQRQKQENLAVNAGTDNLLQIQRKRKLARQLKRMKNLK